jgi:hypothetical protein
MADIVCVCVVNEMFETMPAFQSCILNMLRARCTLHDLGTGLIIGPDGRGGERKDGKREYGREGRWEM